MPFVTAFIELYETYRYALWRIYRIFMLKQEVKIITTVLFKWLRTQTTLQLYSTIIILPCVGGYA
jgi:hypothetical protein